MLFIHQVVPGSEGHQVRVVGRRRDGDGARAAHVGVAQLVGEDLQLVRREAIVIPEHVVVRRSACSLEPDHTAHQHSQTSPELPPLLGTAAQQLLPQEVLHISASFFFKRQTTSFLAAYQNKSLPLFWQDCVSQNFTSEMKWSYWNALSSWKPQIWQKAIRWRSSSTNINN